MSGGTIDDLRGLEGGYDSDKASWAQYMGVYQDVLAPYRDGPCTILELGVRNGGSLLMWRDFLPRATIVGLDLEIPPLDDDSGRIRTYEGSQDDTALLSRVIAEQAPEGFDVVIDDCAHVGSLATASFQVLFPALKPGGTYVIEDWGTGYWPDWPDGERLSSRPRPPRTGGLRRIEEAAHRFGRAGAALRRALGSDRRPQHVTGMVGFVKMLVDEVASADVRRGGGQPPFGADIVEMRVHPSLVVLRKGDAATA